MDEENGKLTPLIKLIKITKETKEFDGYKKHWLIEDQISYDRWIAFLKGNQELAFNMDLDSMWENLQSAYNANNEGRYADSAVTIRDIMQGVQNMSENRIPAAVKICALFINEPDEDRRFINADMIQRKVEDWRMAGIEMGSFFHLALTISPAFLKIFKLLSPDT